MAKITKNQRILNGDFDGGNNRGRKQEPADPPSKAYAGERARFSAAGKPPNSPGEEPPEMIRKARQTIRRVVAGTTT